MKGLGSVNFDTIAVDWKDMAHLRIVEGKEYFVTICILGWSIVHSATANSVITVIIF